MGILLVITNMELPTEDLAMVISGHAGRLVDSQYDLQHA